MLTTSTLKPAPFSRSPSSSASSLSSTFSDIITLSSSSSSPSTASKTHAFFASPFSTEPPSPIQQHPHTVPVRSLNADFFATPVRPPSPPTSATIKKQHTIHLSRIFPSRYTSTVENRSPDFVSLDINSHQRSPSSGSDSSFTSSFIETRLPTPPPPALPRLSAPRTSFESTSSNEPTPRPPNLEPTLLHFEKSLLLATQEKQKRDHQHQPEPEPDIVPDDDEEVEEEPQPGSIISFDTEHHIPQFSLSPLTLTFATATLNQEDRGTPTPTNEPSTTLIPNTSSSAPSLPTSPNSTSTPTLRLLRSLGHGAFSAVWLAEDLSRVPLTLVSKKSVRDLRRRVSGRDKEREREKKGKEEMEKFGVEESPKDITKIIESDSPRRPPRKLKDGLKSMLSFSRLPKLALPPPFDSRTDDLYKSPSDLDSSLSWDSYGLPSSTSLHFLDVDMCPSTTLSRTSSTHSYASFSGGTTGLSRHPSLKFPATSRGDSTSLSRDSSLKKFRDRVRGTRPAFRLGRAYLDERHGEMGWEQGVGGAEKEDDKGEQNHLGANLSRRSSNTVNSINSRLVAVKMTPRKVRGSKGRREKAEEERTRVGFVREVEVLKHISHPNITPLLAHLSTATHHILVLPYLSGGDLLGLVNNDVAWGKLGESVLRRIWYELCKAVGWMHGVGLVHRDIKLENILLTTQAFNSLTPTCPPPTLCSLPTPPTPFIKLTDFGLSRFVEIDANGEAELLWTRCGSEAYAAPELVTGGGGGEGARRGVYDARKTDAWACGVVLYALVGRQLPFGEGVAQPVGGGGDRIGGEKGAERGSLAERRHWLMRIARGEYEWPGGEGVEERQRQVDENEDELIGNDLMYSQGAKRIVGRLLIRDPRKRARIGDLWDDSWMSSWNGNGGDEEWWKERERWYESSNNMEGVSPEMQDQHEDILRHENLDDVQGQHVWIFDQTEGNGDSLVEGGDGEELLEEEEEGGCLFDHEGINSITRQEVV